MIIIYYMASRLHCRDINELVILTMIYYIYFGIAKVAFNILYIILSSALLLLAGVNLVAARAYIANYKDGLWYVIEIIKLNWKSSILLLLIK